MDLLELRNFFMWCSIINSALIFFVFLFYAFGSKWIYKNHSRWFPMSEESFYTVSYAFLGVYKVLVFVFNIVPFVTLWIMA